MTVHYKKTMTDGNSESTDGTDKLGVIIELYPSDEVQAENIIEVLENSGYNTTLERQSHDTIRGVESLEYNVKCSTDTDTE